VNSFHPDWVIILSTLFMFALTIDDHVTCLIKCSHQLRLCLAVLLTSSTVSAVIAVVGLINARLGLSSATIFASSVFGREKRDENRAHVLCNSVPEDKLVSGDNWMRFAFMQIDFLFLFFSGSPTQEPWDSRYEKENSDGKLSIKRKLFHSQYRSRRPTMGEE
jgi:hypothetical protein